MAVEAYPLAWPPGWPRHKGARDWDSRFRGPTYRWDRVMKGLQEEIRRIGGTHLTISTNQPLRRDGYPYAEERRIDDPGVAIYFKRGGKSLVMAQDRFQTVLGNMRSLTMAIEGLRQMERHGGAVMLERAFDGFLALPSPTTKKGWREVFGMSAEFGTGKKVDSYGLQTIYRAKARERHPDNGGSDAAMAELNVAYQEAKCELGIS